jgi:hypothetical protein
VRGAEPQWWPYGSAALRRVLRFDATSELVPSPEPVLCRIYRERTVR